MSKQKRYLLVILAAILVFIPWSYPQLFLLSWIAFIPLLFAFKNINKEKAFKYGYLFGFIIMLGSAHWLYYSIVYYSGFPWILSIILLLFFFLIIASFYGVWAFLFVLFQGTKGLNPFLLAFSWTGMEYLRYQVISAFPFGYIGYTQVNFLSTLQLASLGGVFLVSFIILLVNAYLFKLINLKSIKMLVPVIIVFIFIFIYASLEINEYNNRQYEKVNIALVQTNISQAEKWKAANIEPNLNFLLDQSKLIKEADIIIWPESSLTFDIIRNSHFRNKLKDGLKDIGTHVLSGSLAIGEENRHLRYNSSFLTNEQGEIITRYDKLRLVLFGERMPFYNLVRKITNMNLASSTPGEELIIFETPFLTWRTAICSEILYPRMIIQRIEEADLIINQSNEAWFHQGNLQEQIWTAAKFRAVENRRSIVKTGNFSYSGLISPLGVVIESKNRDNKESMIVQAGKNRDNTFYQKWGDFPGYLSLLFIILILVIKSKKLRQKK